jgi:hypothetical protein
MELLGILFSLISNLSMSCIFLAKKAQGLQGLKHEGVSIMLNTIELLWLPNFTSKGAVLWVTSLEDKGHLSITSTCI